MSEITKRALAASLKKLMAQKPLDKVTVTDLAEDCGVNRQTFYYHFADIFDLLEWIYLNETSLALAGKKTYDTWQEGFLQIANWVQNNQEFVKATYHSVCKEHLVRYLYTETQSLLLGVIDEKAAGHSLCEGDRLFLADFYKYAFVGLMLDWIGTGLKEPPATLIARIGIATHGNITRAIDAFSHHPVY